MKWILILTLMVSSISASEVSLDVGQTKTLFNRISIPQNDADQLSLPKGDKVTSYRLTGFFDTESGNQIYALIAPLEVSYKFRSTKSFNFNDTLFLNNRDTTLNYKFNSYRLGYLWTWRISNLKYWVGLVGKIRDADTEVVQNDRSDSFDNIGFVPLLAAGFEYRFLPFISLFTHTDALGSQQGSAYDSQFELRFIVNTYAISLGKRILGGGADNDTVYNFAQFDTEYLRLTKYF